MADHNISINVNLNDGEALNILRQIRDLVRQIANQRINLEIHGDFKQVLNQFSQINQQVNNLNGQSINPDMSGVEGQLQTISDGVSSLVGQVQDLNDTAINIEANTSDLDQAREDVYSLSDALSDLASIAGAAADAMDLIGGFSSGVGKAFSGMAGMFDFDFLSTAGDKIVELATETVTGSIGNVISRYDIMNTFVPYMEIAGVTEEVANEALDRVNQSILGLPIKLDESAVRLRRYQMYMGDIDRATNLTIGLQNAITAGGASESMKTYAYMEIDRLLASGELATSKQWQSLINGLGVSQKFIAEAISELEGVDISAGELAQGLMNGDISAESFMKALEYMGQEWDLNSPNTPDFIKNMHKALETYKGTLDAWVNMIDAAVDRGGQKVLDSVNETLKGLYGLGIEDFMETVRNEINGIFQSVADFIRNNPESIDKLVDIVTGVWDRLKGIDWAGVANMAIDNLGRLFDIIFDIWDSLPPGSVEEFVAFATTMAGPLGKAFQALSDGFPLMLGIFKSFKDFDFEGLAENVLGKVENIVNTISKIIGMFPPSFIEDILAFGLVYAGPLSKAFRGISSILNMLSGLRLSGLLGGLSFGNGGGMNFASIGQMFVGASAFIGVIGEIGLVIWEYAEVFNNIAGMDFDGLSQNLPKVVEFVGLVASVAGVITGVLGIGGMASEGLLDIALLGGEAVLAGFGAVVAEIGGIMYEYAEIAEKLSGMDVDWNSFVVNGESMAVGFGYLSAAMAALGTLDMMTFPQQFFANVTAGEISDTMEKISAALSAIDGATIPEAGKITQLLDAFKEIKTAMTPGILKSIFGDIEVIGTFWQKKTIQNSMEAIKEMADGLTSIAHISNTDIDIDNVSTNIEKIVETMAEVGKALTANFDQNETGDLTAIQADTAFYGQIIENVNDAMGSIGEVVDTMISLGDRLSGLGIGIDSEGNLMQNSMFGRLKSRILALTSAITEVYSALKEGFGMWEGIGPGLDGANEKRISSNEKTIVENMSEVFDSISAIVDGLIEIDGKIGELGIGDEGFGALTGNIETLVGTVKKVGSLLVGKDGFLGVFESLFSSWTTGNGADMMTNFSGMLDGIGDIADILKEMGGHLEGLDMDTVDEQVTQIQEMLQGLGSMFEVIAAFDPRGDFSANGEIYVKELDNLRAAMINVERIAQRLSWTQEIVSEVNSSGAVTGIKTLLMSLKNALAQIPEDPGDVFARAETLASAVGEVKDIIDTISGMQEQLSTAVNNGIVYNISTLLQGIIGALSGDVPEGMVGILQEVNTMIASLPETFSELDGVDMSGLTEQLQNVSGAAESVATNSHDATQKINLLGAMAGARAGSFGGLIGAIQSVGSAAAMATGEVNALGAAINNLPSSKTISINVAVNRSSLPFATFPAKGGLIGADYLAVGGFPGMAKGTDTIPAWLTPGEFVMRRAAVGMFGSRFMDRVNKMDIGGAFDALMTRISNPMSYAGATYNRDNHATVNNYFMGDGGQNYSQRKAYRYVRGL